jgi:DNA-directed RNA polymerase subunit L
MENVKQQMNGYRLTAELKDVPVSFVNGLRRILLSELPTVVLSNIQILENSSSMTHEMLQHRISMLPVNVRPEETAVIRDTKLELRKGAEKDELELTTNDFSAEGPRPDVLLKDRDLGTPLLFLRLKPGESVHVKASVSTVTSGASQVCVSTFRNHIDLDVAKIDRDTFVAKVGDDPKAQREAGRVFDTFYIQRSFSRDKETGRPNWFDLTVESIGVTPAKDLLRKAVELLKAKIIESATAPILREPEGWYSLEIPGETHTVGQLVQELFYIEKLADFVSCDVGHPLVPKLVIRFHNTTESPDALVQKMKDKALTLCENVLKSV